MYNRIASLALAVLLLSGCGAKSNAIKPEPLTSFEYKARIEKIWSRDFGSIDIKRSARLSPYIKNTSLFVADSKGKVSAYHAENGKKIWRMHIKQAISGAIGVGDGNVYVGTRKGDLVALDAETGKLRWQQQVGSEMLSPAVSDTGIVVVQSSDGKILGLSAEDGKQLWTVQRNEPSLTLRGTSTPIIFQGIAITGFANGSIIAIRVADGQELWEIPIAYPKGKNEIERLVDIDAQVAIAGDLLFAASYQGKLVAINIRNGRKEWSKDFSTYSGMDLDDRNIYLTDEEGNVVAFDQRTGASLWKQDKLKGRRLSPPASLSSYLAVGDLEGYVHILSKDDGSQVSRYRLGSDPINVKPIVWAGTLYVSNLDGDLAALRIQ
ncbi:MAG: outer membrane protein assembly factor BamB [Gammaproteobacteria bacterium]|nr:outer membrane protein assembly factor BamB [Gammaproteobacteria bacterium]